MPADAEPTTIRTARGEYSVDTVEYPSMRRPWLVTVSVHAGPHHWQTIVSYWLATEADARRVARNLETDVRENRIE